MRFNTFILLAMAALALATGGCSRTEEAFVMAALPVPDGADCKVVTGEKGRYGGVLVMAAISDPKTFNPIVASETSSTEVLDHMFSGLVERNGETLKFEPALAKKWTTSPDGRIWTFTLRRKLFWSDGMPITADDIIFTFNDVIYNPDIPNSSADVLTVDGKPIQVTKVDDLTVRFTLPKPFAPFLNGLTGPIVPRHKLAESVKAKRFMSTWGVNTPPEEIVCSGPFLLKKYSQAEKVVLSRNPHYWKMDADGRRLPYLDGWIYAIVPDLDASLLKFKSGQTDTISIRGSDYAMVRKWKNTSDFSIYDLGPAFGTEMLFLNMNPRAAKLSSAKREWFSDRSFREALAYAIDKKSIVDTVFNGLAAPLWGPESPANRIFYNPDVARYEYDPDKARRTLAAAGYLDRNGDNLIEDRQGRTVAFTMITNVENGERVKQANLIKDDLTRLGIKVTLTPVAFNKLVTMLDRTLDWEVCLLGFTGGPEPHSGRNLWHSGGQLHIWNPAQPHPATPWEARIDRIFDTAAVTIDDASRKALYGEFQAIVAREIPVLFLVTPTRMTAVRNRFGNLRPAVSGAFWNEWQIFAR